jgi:hypothetical protein
MASGCWMCHMLEFTLSCPLNTDVEFARPTLHGGGILLLQRRCRQIDDLPGLLGSLLNTLWGNLLQHGGSPFGLIFGVNTPSHPRSPP